VCVCGGGGLVLGIFLSLFTSIHLCIFDGGGGGGYARSRVDAIARRSESSNGGEAGVYARVRGQAAQDY
jgi:hypothetical protein